MKGLVFSLDALFALLLVLIALPALYLASNNLLNPAVYNENLHSTAVESVNLLAETKVSDLLTDPYVKDLFNQGVLDSTDVNKTMMELIGGFWASGDSGNLSIARNLSQYFFGKVMNPSLHYALYYSTDVVFNTSEPGTNDALALSRRLVSGVAKGLPATGCVSRASLKKIGGKQEKSFYFMGGFIGQGNLSFYLTDIPADANVSNIYLEFNAGDNFTLFVNNYDCGLFNKTAGNASVDSWTVSDASCLSALNLGSSNLFKLNFTGSNVKNQFIGGGFVRVTYDTNSFNPGNENTTRFYFTGVDGLVNEYSSLYVPGTVTNISASLHLKNNYTTFLTVGNYTILNDSGSTSSDRVIFVDSSNFTNVFSFDDLSLKTIPLRLGLEANITGGDIGNADIILVTDVSGSMAWRVNQDGTTGTTVTNCSSSNINLGTTSRISVAKCVDKDFIDTILATPGNRIGLVSFSTSTSAVNLSTDATSLKAAVDAYSTGGGTCISCAINDAYNILAQWPSEGRNRFVVMMTDGVPNYRSTDYCFDSNALASNSSFTIQGGESGAFVHYNAFWSAATSTTSNSIYGVDALNSSVAYAVGASYKIFSWNGVSWSESQDLGSQDLYDVDLYNVTLGFAVGASGKIVRWFGTTWSEQTDVGNSNLRGVKVYNSTLAFAVGSSGEIYRWNGNTWSLYQDVGNTNFYSVDVFNSSLGFAVGGSGQIYRWTGTTWTLHQDLGSMTVTDVHIFNSTLAFVTTDDGRIYRWTGSTWSQVYSGSYALNTIRIINSTLGFALGNSRGGVVEWNGASWTQTFPAYLYSGNSTSGLTCSDDDSCSLTQNIPMLNANYSSCRVHNEQNGTVYSVGFGPITTCGLANSTLNAIASCGNGSVYLSNNATELQFAFQNIAEKIIQQSTASQTVIATGDVVTSLYPDSYIEVSFDPVNPDYEFNEILLTQETNKFPSCQGSFFVPPQLSVESVKVTSYSADLWTSNVTISNSLGDNNVFYLGDYGAVYSKLGDPFLVEFPASFVANDENNVLTVKLGSNSTSVSNLCSQDNRVIYGLRVKAVVGYSSIFSECKARNATVFYDSDFDGVPDGSVDLTVGDGLQSAGSSYVGVDQLNTSSNAVDDALLRLLSLLNLVNASGSGLPGSFSNPIDVQLSESVSIDVLSGQQVPFFWGPTEVTVVVWN
ncbi:VWA domain-containing protein [Candidatus Micrarchaeota archaeon]|nr:VWA domain-containing protein [Candidatus Micrarchaeota archaeon]